MSVTILGVAGDMLRAVAPTIATALGGPFAGQAVTSLLTALGLAPDTPTAQAAAAIQNATPEQLLAIKKADNDFAATMKGLDIELDRLDVTDRDSARKRQIGVADQTPAVLAYALTAGFFLLLGLAAVRGFPAENTGALNILLGTLGTAWIGAMTFFFGSTASSREKSWMLFNSAPSDPPTATPATPAGRA